MNKHTELFCLSLIEPLDFEIRLMLIERNRMFFLIFNK